MQQQTNISSSQWRRQFIPVDCPFCYIGSSLSYSFGSLKKEKRKKKKKKNCFFFPRLVFSGVTNLPAISHVISHSLRAMYMFGWLYISFSYTYAVFKQPLVFHFFGLKVLPILYVGETGAETFRYVGLQVLGCDGTSNERGRENSGRNCHPGTRIQRDPLGSCYNKSQYILYY